MTDWKRDSAPFCAAATATGSSGYAENHENLKSEFYIPTMVNKLIGDGTATLRVLRSAAQWHGVTYREDRGQVRAAFEKMLAQGLYPALR